MNHAARSLYVHIPFCSFACHYCDFSKTADLSDDLISRYFSVLRQNLKSNLDQLMPGLDTVYFGGGTPGLFTTEIKQILEVLEGRVADQTEVTIEVNPNNLSTERLRFWLDAGIGRYSVGVQTFDPVGIKALTRDHDAKQTKEALLLLGQAKVNWSMDLIYGWHKQTLQQWKADLERIFEVRPPHVSIYNLTYEPGTPYYLREQRGVLQKCEQQVEADMYGMACQMLADAGYEHYELASWAQPQMQSRHNSGYWDLNSCLAIGSGAHGFFRGSSRGNGRYSPGIRYSYPKNIQSYLQSWQNPDTEDNRGLLDLVLEYGLVRLRTKKGLQYDDLKTIAGETFASNLWSNLKASRIFERYVCTDRIVLSEEQWFVENRYLREFHTCIETVNKINDK